MKIRMLCLALLCFGQTNAQFTNPLDSQMVALTQNLNFTEVSSGILFDRGIQTAKPSGFNGTSSADTLFSFDNWWLQYAAMYTGNVAANNTLDAVGAWKPQALALVDSGIVPLMVMDVNYHRLAQDSVLFFNSFNLVNDQLYDISGRTQSPYEAHQLVSFSPRKSNWYDDLSVDFQINSEFIISNTSKTLSTVEVDFGRGAGYQTVALNSAVKVTYTQYGIKWLKLKLTYTDGSFYHAVSKFTLHSDGSDQPKSLNGNYDEVVQIEHPTLSNHGAELQIDYGCNNEGEIRKPYIYVEGFNPEEFGDMNYNRLYDDPSLTDRDDLYPSWQFYQFVDYPTSGYRILNELQANNYDIIYVDFKQGAGNIIYNAQTLMEVIKWVNEQKAANCSSYPNTLVGYSMGGIVARLALTYMENEEDAGTGPPHDVSYYVSLDSPHLGANIPRGLIASITDAKSYQFLGFNVTDGIDAVQEAYDVLFSPAARQMLYYSGEGNEFLVTGHGPTYTEFQNILQTQGMPQRTIRNFAISKGNSSGNDQGFGGQAALVDIKMNSFNATGCLVNVDNNLGDAAINAAGFLAGGLLFAKLGLFAHVRIDIDAMPGYITSEARIYKRRSRIFFVFIPLQWENYETKAKTVYSYDGEQGGNYPYSSFGGDGFLEDAVANVYSPCIKFYFPAFNFIPTASALNIPELKYQPWVSFDPATYLNGDVTDFDKAFVLDPTKYPTLSDAPANESHLDLTPSNVFPFSEFISPNFNSINTSSTIDDYTWNFGYGTQNNEIKETTDRITRLATVGSALPGTVCINCSGLIEKSNNASNPVNEADQFAVELTRNCGSGVGRLVIGANGVLKIGENSQQTGILTVRENSWIELNGGLIEVREGSKLIIESGAELRLNGGQVKVYDGGEIIVKEGGLLIYEDGVNLELNGNDAQLALGGHTHIGDDATFQFSWQGSESGYVRLLKEGYWGQRFSAGTNASVRLEGADKDDLILYLEEDADFWEYSQSDNFQDHGLTSEDFASVLFKDGNIVCEKGSRFVFKAKTAFAHVKIEQFSSLVGDRPRGIVTYTQLNFHQSDADRIDIEGKFNVSGHGYLKFQSSTFERSNISIRGGSFDFASSSFERLTIEEEETVHTSRFTSSHMTGVTSKIISKSHQELRIVGSSISDFAFGVEKHKGQLTVRCSEFKGNYGHDAISLFQNAQLNMSLRTGGGYNYFENNKGHIMVDYSTFFISLGYNTFYDDPDNNHVEATYISGRVGYMPGTDESDYLISTVHNAWTPHGQSPNPAWPDPDKFEIEVWEPVQGNGMVMFYVPFDFGQVMPPTECGLYDYPADPPPVEGPKNGDENTFSSQTAPLMSGTVYFDGLQFDDALQTVSNLLIEADTTESDLGLIADMYYDLLSSVPDCNEPESACKSLNQMCFEALNGYKSIVEILFKEEELTIDENQASFQPTVANYVSTLMAFTDSVKTPENHAKQYDLEMMKVSLFRGIQKYDQALSILVNMEQCEHDSIREVIIDSQIQNILFDQHVHSEGVSYDLENESSFQLDSSLFHLYAQSIIDTSGFGSYITGPNNVMFTHCEVPTTAKSKTVKYEQELVEIFPNPTKGEVQVRLNIPDFLNDDAVYVMTLHDLAGRMVFSELIRSTEQQVVLPNLQRSIYISSISRGDERIFRGKLTVM